MQFPLNDLIKHPYQPHTLLGDIQLLEEHVAELDKLKNEIVGQVEKYITNEDFSTAFWKLYVLGEKTILLTIPDLIRLNGTEQTITDLITTFLKVKGNNNHEISTLFRQFSSWHSLRNEVIHELKEIDQVTFQEFEQFCMVIYETLKQMLESHPLKQKFKQLQEERKACNIMWEDNIKELTWRMNQVHLVESRKKKIEANINTIKQTRKDLEGLPLDSSQLKQIKNEMAKIMNEARKQLSDWQISDITENLNSLQQRKTKIQGELNSIQTKSKPWRDRAELQELQTQEKQLRNELSIVLSSIEKIWKEIQRKGFNAMKFPRPI